MRCTPVARQRGGQTQHSSVPSGAGAAWTSEQHGTAHSSRTSPFAPVHFTRSRANPQFNAKVVRRRLAEDRITYIVMPDLGGRRGRSKEADPERNAGWNHAAFKNDADHAETPSFARAFARLLELARTETCAIVCAEALWWRCHRRIVADYAITAGVRVFHIFTPTSAKRAVRTPFAKLDRRSRTLRYPRPNEAIRRRPRSARSVSQSRK